MIGKLLALITFLIAASADVGLDFIHFSPLGAWAICPAASEFYLGGFKNPPAQNSLYCRANIQRRAAPINGQSPVGERGKKVLVLIIASDNYPIYTEFQESWRSYMHSDPEHFEAYFIKADPTLPTSAKIDGDVIWGKTVEGYPEENMGIITKTVYAMEEMLPRIQNEFDYVIRTNLSTFYIFPRLLKFIETLPSTGCYCGDNTGGDSIIASGTGIIMSKDLVEMLVKNKSSLLSIKNKREPDDCIIGFFLRDRGFYLQRHYKVNIDSLEQWRELKRNFPEDLFQVRVKTNTVDNYHRQDDMTIHRELFEMFYK